MSSRSELLLKAQLFRDEFNALMDKHNVSPPASPQPSKVLSIPTRTPGVSIELYFYFPASYTDQDTKTYPVILNFHGGGFIVGSAKDDARWCKAAAEYADAVTVSVEYRLAPEHPFPIPVQDGVDATLYLITHAEELRLDPHRIALSGFSAGGNLAFSVPILLHEEQKAAGTTLSGSIVSIASWYPSTDFSRSREERRASNPKPEYNIEPFDESYLYTPSGTVDVKTPWLSPLHAPDDLIRDALPKHIVLYTCEYDQVCAEAFEFKERLEKDFGEKKVVYRMVEGVKHGWDKLSPEWDPTIDELYYKPVCLELKSAFNKSAQK